MDEPVVPHYADNKFALHALPILGQELKIAFIGNSLTLHAPGPELGWHHNHGMAAGSTGGDYAHLLLQHLRLTSQQAYIRNFYPFESDTAITASHMASLQDVLARKPAIIVVQLGDNIGSQEQLNNFARNLQLLVHAACAASPNVLCVSTWWHSPAKDYVIERVCQLYGAQYVYIGDLYGSPDNPDRRHITYAHAGVEAHPKDWGMAQISERLYRAILRRLPGMDDAAP